MAPRLIPRLPNAASLRQINKDIAIVSECKTRANWVVNEQHSSIIRNLIMNWISLEWIWACIFVSCTLARGWQWGHKGSERWLYSKDIQTNSRWSVVLPRSEVFISEVRPMGVHFLEFQNDADHVWQSVEKDSSSDPPWPCSVENL